MRSSTLALLAALPLLAACGEEGASEEMRTVSGEANAPSEEIPEEVAEGRYERVGVAEERGTPGDDMAGGALTLEQAVADADWTEEQRARVQYRHPVETLEFFDLEPDMTVAEIWPGGGWYTEVIAPYLAQGGGDYYAVLFDPETGGERVRQAIARFRTEYAENPETYGDVMITALGPETEEIMPAGSADMVLTFRNAHNFVMNGFGESAFDQFYAALKPGGILGVVDHRLPEEADDAMEERSGYLKPSTVIELAEAAGFELVAQSEVNANPQDTADHPFGVWTLPPTSATQNRDGSVPEGFDPEAYKAIGESDRFTMKFVKPLGADGALME